MRNRQSVQEATTLSIRHRHTPTKKKHENTVNLMEQSRKMAAAPPEVPPDENIVVTMRGRVKTQEEMQVGHLLPLISTKVDSC